MSPSSDQTPPSGAQSAAHQRAVDELAGLALGNTADAATTAHVTQCAQCQDELSGYRAIVELARVEQPDVTDDDGPSPQVWTRILAELSASPVVATPPGPDAPVRQEIVRGRGSRTRTVMRRVAYGVVAAVVVAAVGVAGWAIGRSGNGTPSSSAQAQLAAQPGTAASAHGHAVMHASADGYQMRLTTDGLPAPDGYYEVWLYNPSANRMVAIGTLGTDASGVFTVPAGIDTGAYHVVDVSDQRYNGDATHQTSVLRGPLAAG